MFLRQRVLLVLIIVYSLCGIGRIQAQETILSTDSLGHPVAAQLPDSSLRALSDTLKALSDTLNPDTTHLLQPDTLFATHLPADSLAIPGSLPANTLPIDTLAVPVDTVRQKGMLDAPVIYQAADSIMLTGTNMAYLYGEGDVKYQQMQLQSELIEMDMSSSVVSAFLGVDSIGEEFGFPLYIDGEQHIEAKFMRYNFVTRKAYVTTMLTQQGEGFLTAGTTKKLPDNSMNLVDGLYSTCDEHEHPHFGIKITKAKVRPGKNIVSGPVYLVIEEVPLYLIGLPFAFFPFTDTYSSGILMPTYGDEMTQGFYLRDGGYYFAISDYVDLAMTGEIYTKGSWGLGANSSYRKRYKYSGHFDASYLTTKLGDKGLPDYSVSKDFRINWSHTQDPKANPFLTYSASINFSTSQYDRNKVNQMYTAAATQNNKGSSVSISKRFPTNPLSISATMNINQRSQDSSISVTLPDLTLTMSRIYPLKRKNPVGAERWYEKLSLSYTGYLRNSIDSKESEILQKSLVKDWKNGMQHSIPLSATYTLFGYLNISPSVNYQERWYTNKIYQAYDSTTQRIAPSDTSYGFYRVYNYSTSLSLSTTLYGMFVPWKIFGDRLQVIRHRMEPSFSLSAVPDFGASKYGYYENYSYVNGQGQTVTGTYSPYQNGLFGVPGRGKQGNLSMGLENNVEAKIRSNRDSSGLKKISLIDNLSFRISYNMVADSFKWSDLNVGLRLKLSKSYTLNLSGAFDTYTYGYNETTGQPYRIDKTSFVAGKGFGRLGQLRGTSTSFSYTLNNDWFKQRFGRGDKSNSSDKNLRNPSDPQYEDDDDELTDQDREQTSTTGKNRLRETKKSQAGEYDDNGYYIASLPWSFSFSYNLGISYGQFDPEKLRYKYQWRHALSFNGSIQPTKKWNMTFNTTYDFDTHKISYMTCNITRDLHCFQFSASLMPIGYHKSYMFSVRVNSSLLQDLKYQQSSSYRSGQNWY